MCRTDTGSVPTPAGGTPELVFIKHDLHASISAHAGLFDWIIYKRNNKFYTLSSPGSSSRPGLGEPPPVLPPVPPPGFEPEPEPFPLPPCFEPVPVDFPLGSGTTTSLPLEITTQMGLLPATFNRYARFLPVPRNSRANESEPLERPRSRSSAKRCFFNFWCFAPERSLVFKIFELSLLCDDVFFRFSLFRARAKLCFFDFLSFALGGNAFKAIF